jgi:hypothetical protein
MVVDEKSLVFEDLIDLLSYILYYSLNYFISTISSFKTYK